MTGAGWSAELVARTRPPESEDDWAAIESFYSLLQSIERRKLLGQFMTPPRIASLMARWVLGCNPRTILDPAVGLGIFPWTIFRLRRNVEVQGIDIDPEMSAAAAAFVPELKTTTTDFLSMPDLETYDGIICNPPYVRHHVTKLPEELFDRCSLIVGERLSRLTNIYALFLIEITRRLTNGGRAAVITPSEYLNADFGVAVKRYLVERGFLSGMVIFDHAAEVFGDALTTASIALIESPTHASPRDLRLFRVSDTDGVTQLEEELASNGRFLKHPEPVEGCPASVATHYASVSLAPSLLDPHSKWHFLGLAEPQVNGSTLGDYVRCCRGIATGANDFFTIRPSEAEAFGLPPECLIPCITKSAHVPGNYFTENDLARLITANKRVFLVDTAADHSAVKDYLALGKSRGVHNRYLPAHRNPWYALEKREPAPLWVTVFGRGGFRFISNHTRALNLTTFHCIYPHRLPPGISIDELASLLSGERCRQAIQEQMRVYGGGLGKLEPCDVLRIRMPFGD